MSSEGSLQAPTRHPLEWQTPAFYDPHALEQELERVFDICHGCRRCFSLCNAFPTLFDAVDATPEGEVAAVDKKVFWEVVDHCYLCDMCFMTKCPYVPPHPWNVDFPHLMLRAKAVRVKKEGLGLAERVLADTDTVGNLAGIPVVGEPVRASADTQGKVALFTTCYGNRNEPELDEDLVAVFEHNGIEVALLAAERCCGMPRLELGDLAGVAKLKEHNIPQLIRAIEAGFDLLAPIPSCVLMFKQELPLMFPQDAQVRRVAEGIFDPFEYLMLRHAAGLLRTDFKAPLGKVSYHVPCHLRVQNLGLKTRDLLRLVPGTTLDTIERCSGHDGTYGVKKRFRAASMRIGRPVMQRVQAAQCDHYASDCPMAGHQIESGLKEARAPEHPLRLLRLAYGL